MVQLDQTSADDSSPTETQCWQNFVNNIQDPEKTLTCQLQANSLLIFRNPIFPPTRSHRRQKAEGMGHDHEARRECIGNSDVHKLVERQRQNQMKALCSNIDITTPRRI